MRSDAANVGNKGSELLILERHDVGRRKVVGDDNQVFSPDPLGYLDRRLTWPPDQHSDDPFDDLAHVEMCIRDSTSTALERAVFIVP